MSKITKIGKVKSYDPLTGKVVCHGDPSVFFWKGGVVRTSGLRKSVCHTTTKLFDVTISAATAARLVPDFQLCIEYDDKAGALEVITKFADEAPPPQ